MADLTKTSQRLGEPGRVEAALAFLASEPPIDQIQEVLSELADRLQVPLVAATVLDKTTQHIVATNHEPLPSTTNEDSYCQYVIGAGAFICITDSTTETPWKRLRRVFAAGEPVNAYLGFPLRYRGFTVGSVCAVDSERHEWTTKDQYEVYRTSRQVESLVS